MIITRLTSLHKPSRRAILGSPGFFKRQALIDTMFMMTQGYPDLSIEIGKISTELPQEEQCKNVRSTHSHSLVQFIYRVFFFFFFSHPQYSDFTCLKWQLFLHVKSMQLSVIF